MYSKIVCVARAGVINFCLTYAPSFDINHPHIRAKMLIIQVMILHRVQLNRDMMNFINKVGYFLMKLVKS